MSKKSEDKKKLAKILYMSGEPQQTIADKAGVSRQTIIKWINTEGWAEQRAAANITRPELVNKLLLTINKIIEEVNTDDDPMKLASVGDKLSKVATVIEKLDKKASVVDAIEVFMAFGKWLQYRATFDEGISPELVKTICDYQDKYISELISGTTKQ